MFRYKAFFDCGIMEEGLFRAILDGTVEEGLFRAILDGTVEDVKRLLDADPDKINARVNVCPGTTTTLLNVAMYRYGPNLEVARLLLQRKANVEDRNSNGDCPLHSAIGSYRPKLVQELIKHKANVRALDSRGLTCLTNAICKRDWKVLEILLDAGAPRTQDDMKDVTFSELYQRRERCFSAARTLCGFVRYRIRVHAGGCTFTLPADLCQQMARYVWATRNDAELWN